MLIVSRRLRAELLSFASLRWNSRLKKSFLSHKCTFQLCWCYNPTLTTETDDNYLLYCSNTFFPLQHPVWWPPPGLSLDLERIWISHVFLSRFSESAAVKSSSLNEHVTVRRAISTWQEARLRCRMINKHKNCKVLWSIWFMEHHR